MLQDGGGVDGLGALHAAARDGDARLVSVLCGVVCGARYVQLVPRRAAVALLIVALRFFFLSKTSFFVVFWCYERSYCCVCFCLKHTFLSGEFGICAAGCPFRAGCLDVGNCAKKVHIVCIHT